MSPLYCLGSIAFPGLHMPWRHDVMRIQLSSCSRSLRYASCDIGQEGSGRKGLLMLKRLHRSPALVFWAVRSPLVARSSNVPAATPSGTARDVGLRFCSGDLKRGYFPDTLWC